MDIEQRIEFLNEPVAPPGAPAPPPAPQPPAPPPPPPGWTGEWQPPPPPDPPAVARRRWRFVPRSITARLVTGVVTLVVVVVLATGIGTYFALRAFLYDRLDQQLQSTAGSTTSIETLFNPGEPISAGVRAPQFVWTVALDEAGNVLANPLSSSVEPMKLSATDRRALAARTTSKPLTITTMDGEQLRVEVRQLQIRGVSPGVAVNSAVVIGLSTGEIDRTLHRLLVLELLIGAVAVTVALVATTGGVRFSLRHLFRVTRTAQEVAAELSPSGSGLERRVPVEDGDTTEVGQLAESMNTLLSAVETQFTARLDSERRMRQFMADASHELRTPLTSIRGYAELARMRRGVGDDDDGDATADNLERIESEGTRMSRLVDDLLILARSDQGTLPEKEVVDVRELLDDVVASCRAAYPEREIRLVDGPPLTVIGDHDQLIRAVRNLVTNAASHTPPSGTIDVRAFASGTGVAIQVVDEGPGLPPEDAAHVFERFWRADKARTRARGGTGLGLAIVASIVHLHGGTVQFQSTVEHGSTVTVWLPATELSASPGVPEQ
jgi:two-component system OmpR family sensor kinase